MMSTQNVEWTQPSGDMARSERFRDSDAEVVTCPRSTSQWFSISAWSGLATKLICAINGKSFIKTASVHFLDIEIFLLWSLNFVAGGKGVMIPVCHFTCHVSITTTFLPSPEMHWNQETGSSRFGQKKHWQSLKLTSLYFISRITSRAQSLQLWHEVKIAMVWA